MKNFILFATIFAFFTACNSPSTPTPDPAPFSETAYVTITENDISPSTLQGFQNYRSLYYIKSVNEEPEQLEGEVLVSVSDTFVYVTVPNLKSQIKLYVVNKEMNVKGEKIISATSDRETNIPDTEITINFSKNLIIMEFKNSTYYFYDCEAL
jgi:hypothetical protein